MKLTEAEPGMRVYANTRSHSPLEGTIIEVGKPSYSMRRLIHVRIDGEDLHLWMDASDVDPVNRVTITYKKEE